MAARGALVADSMFSRLIANYWRADETFVSVRGKRHYCYRAVGGIADAQRFFRKVLATNLNLWPRKGTLDGVVGRARVLHVPSRSMRRNFSCNWLHWMARPALLI
jgi:transposase-like protein